jgi:hypothetical protein
MHYHQFLQFIVVNFHFRKVVKGQGLQLSFDGKSISQDNSEGHATYVVQDVLANERERIVSTTLLFIVLICPFRLLAFILVEGRAETRAYSCTYALYDLSLLCTWNYVGEGSPLLVASERDPSRFLQTRFVIFLCVKEYKFCVYKYINAQKDARVTSLSLTSVRKARYVASAWSTRLR